MVHVEPGLPLVACHGVYLQQLFDNLVSNALKFTREGNPPEVKISGHVQGSMVVFSVEDHGIGIPVTQRTRVFQPFVRLLTADAAGDGIGLAIIQRIVELYGGKVWIDGAEGAGLHSPLHGSELSEPRGNLERHEAVVEGSRCGGCRPARGLVRR